MFHGDEISYYRNFSSLRKVLVPTALLLFVIFQSGELCADVIKSPAFPEKSVDVGVAEALTPTLSSTDISSRLEKCRVQLKDIERQRYTAKKIGNIKLFEDLVTHAEHILKQIEENGHTAENYLLLGECQGVLTSLQFSLNLGQYGGKQRYAYKKGPNNTPANPAKRQAVSTANRTEPTPKKYTFDDEHLTENRVQPATSAVSVHHTSLKIQRAGHPKHDDDDLHAMGRS